MYAGALFIKLLLNIDNIYWAIGILLVVSALFTIGGGLTAVIWTDFTQMFIMIGGAVVLAILSEFIHFQEEEFMFILKIIFEKVLSKRAATTE